MGSEWVFEYMCQVLQSPSWEVPVMTYIDENCAVFDNEEENKLTHMDVHLEFKNLVESLLTQHLTEVGITSDEFYESCEVAYLRRDNSDFAKKIIEQLIACDDFMIFKAIMFKRNKELEFEALMSMTEEVDDEEEEYDMRMAKKNSFRESKHREAEDEQEAEELDAALALSEETEKMKEISLLEKEQADLEAAIALSLVMEEERLRILAGRENSESKTSESKESKDEESKNNGRGNNSKLPPISMSYNAQLENFRENKEQVEKALNATGSLRTMGTSGNFDEYDVAQRKKHLEAQRKKILAKKQKEREQQLKDYNAKKESSKGPASPKDVVAQRKVTSEQGQLTYALARRMKQELVETTEDDEDVLSSLDAKLKQVEQLRRERASLLRG